MAFERLRMVAALLWLSGVGCDGAVPAIDGGPEPDAGPQADGGLDAGGRDEDPPLVTSTRPRDGEELVPRTEPIEIRFSEPIGADAGTIVVTSGTETIELAARTIDPEGDVVRVAPSTAWPGGARVDVRVEAFADLAGNAQESALEFVFHTNDDGAPTVVETTPAEGATAVAVTLDTISVRFSEPMSPVLGTLTLEGGPGTIGAPVWSSETEARATVSGLDYGTDYRVVLAGFEDRSANLLDTAALGDGAIDFTTEPDLEAPTVIDSNPTNGQLDVATSTLRTIAVTFSEPMDTSARTAVLTGGTTTSNLTGNWSPDGTVLTFGVVGRIVVDEENHLDLSAMRDRHGNAIALDVNLTDGELVFTTSSADSILPFVVFTTPVEGAADVSTRTGAIEILFSEAMDTARTTVDLVSGTTATLSGTWNAAGTRLTVPAALVARAAYTIDLTGFQDATGNALDATHAYLGDGSLSFQTSAATGETCADALTIADATLESGAYEWEIDPSQFVIADNSPSCGGLTTRRDGVLVYEKTTADLASGGTALRITATSPDDLDGVLLEIYRGVCDPDDVGGGAVAREVCLTGRLRWTQYLDVPAGTYFVHVASDTTDGRFLGATVRIEEITTIPEGEGCGDPFDASSSTYASVGGEHVWTIPHGAGQSSEYGTATDGAGSIECATQHGPDAVIRIDKARTSSILDVNVEPFPAETGSGIFDRAGVVVDVLDACDPLAAGTTSLDCRGRTNNPERFQLAGPAGDYYVWLAANNSEVDHVQTTLRVREIDPAPGETCTSAIPIAPGTSVPITPSSTQAYFAPSCVPTTSGITWYRFTTTRELSVVSVISSEPAALATLDATTNTELGCVANASVFGVPRRAPVGSDVCIAVPSSAAITGLSIRELDWRGVQGTGTDLGITRPVDGSSNPISITGESFLEVTPTQLYLAINPNSTSTTTSAPALVTVARSGGVADRLLLDRFTFGNAGVAIGEAIFSVEETNRPARLHRLIDGTGSLAPTQWDPGSVYLTPDIDALTYVAAESLFVMANDGSRTSTTHVPTTFYSASSTAPGAVTRLGDNLELRDVVAVAADATWLYLIGTSGPITPSSAAVRTVYRVPRADVTALPEPMAPADLVGFSTTNGSIVLDAGRDILYFRSTDAPRGLHAIFDASTPDPLYVGPVFVRGGSSDFGLALDPAVPAVFMFETETVTTGTIVEIR
jgi:hypothetical protein